MHTLNKKKYKLIDFSLEISFFDIKGGKELNIILHERLLIYLA